jgi:hypothetical protein
MNMSGKGEYVRMAAILTVRRKGGNREDSEPPFLNRGLLRRVLCPKY